MAKRTALDGLSTDGQGPALMTNGQQAIPEDVGGSGESAQGSKPHVEPSTVNHAGADINETGSGDFNALEDVPGISTMIGYMILRAVLYLAVTFAIVAAGVYLTKLSGLYDPCENNSFVHSQCTAESHAFGLMYYVKCTEEHFCLLPGFWSKTSRAGWSFSKPNEPESSMIDSELPGDNPLESVENS